MHRKRRREILREMAENLEIVRRTYEVLMETGEPAWEVIAADVEFDARA